MELHLWRDLEQRRKHTYFKNVSVPMGWDEDEVHKLVKKRKEEILIQGQAYKAAFEEGDKPKSHFVLRGKRYVYKAGYVDPHTEVSRKLEEIWGSNELVPDSLRDVVEAYVPDQLCN